jgi:hypothetical protein
LQLDGVFRIGTIPAIFVDWRAYQGVEKGDGHVAAIQFLGEIQ